jgi:metal-responsive CopG/Arc/MetJ family transcriptional regulator
MGRRQSRVTITLPPKLLEALDAKLTGEEDTRSAVIRRLIEDALREADEREDVARYIRSYREHPQTEEEYGWSDEATFAALRDLPWEEKEKRNEAG